MVLFQDIWDRSVIFPLLPTLGHPGCVYNNTPPPNHTNPYLHPHAHTYTIEFLDHFCHFSPLAHQPCTNDRARVRALQLRLWDPTHPQKETQCMHMDTHRQEKEMYCIIVCVNFVLVSVCAWLSLSPLSHSPPASSPHVLLLLSDPSSSPLFHRPPLTPLCRETKKKGWKRERKHNRLVPSLILISSSKFDNYTFRVPLEFLCSVRIREKATDSAVEGSSYYEWLTTVLLPLWSKKFWKREQQRSILYSLFGSVCPHPPHPPSEKPADHISRRAHNPLHNLSPCAAD